MRPMSYRMLPDIDEHKLSFRSIFASVGCADRRHMRLFPSAARACGCQELIISITQ